MPWRNKQRKGTGRPHRVFISYSSKDRRAAERFRGVVEKLGLGCWMAPRDPKPGENYAPQIVKAIEETEVLAVLLSAASVVSRHVCSEVARAFEKDKGIYPIRLEQILPTDELELYVTSAHWIEAWDKGIVAAAGEFAEAVKTRPKHRAAPRAPVMAPRPRYGSLLALLVIGSLLAAAVPLALVLKDAEHGPRLIARLPPDLQGWARAAQALLAAPAAAEAGAPVSATGTPAPLAATPAGTPVEPESPPPHPGSSGRPGAVWTSADPAIELIWIDALGLWVGRYEITNEQFARFRPEHWSGRYNGERLDGQAQPVVQVAHHDAAAFVRWLTQRERTAGRLPADWAFRLPTAREWLACARGGDDRMYPWGHTWPPAYGNYGDRTLGQRPWATNSFDDYDDGFRVSAPVPESGRNDWGLFGIGGNVWEYARDTRGDEGVAYGGAWDSATKEQLKCVAGVRLAIDKGRYNVGFRIVLAPHAP